MNPTSACQPRRTAGFALLVSACLAGLLSAQTAPTPTPAPARGDGETVKLEAFTVTGSNLRRLDQENTLPLTVLDRDAMEVRDAAQPADLLVSLPQVSGLPGNETATLGATARGDHSSVSLRGLKSADTLVLLNGRRLLPHGISQGEGGVPSLSVNVNQLPNRGLDRVEVLRDGASALYGTDAVAGVINYITRRDFLGTELSLRYAETEVGDGAEWRGTLTHGMLLAGGRGRAQVVLDVYDREAIFARNRPFMAESDMSYRAPPPWNVSTDTTFNARSATSEFGNYERGTVNSSGVFTPARGNLPASLVATSGRFFLAPTDTGGVGFRTTTPPRNGVTQTFYWNNNDYRVLQPASTRVHAFLSGDYELRPGLTAFAEFAYYDADSTTYREPASITLSTDGEFIVPASNPWNPFGTRFWHPTGAPNTDGTPRLTGTPGDVRISNKRLTDLPDRIAEIDNRTLRGVAGVRGRWGDTWQWEAAALLGENKVRDTESGVPRDSLFRPTLSRTDPAQAFNPFTRTFAVQGGSLVVTGDYQNPSAVLDSFLDEFVRIGRTGLRSVDFGANGELWSLWGGNRQSLALGAEYRHETYSDFRPPFAGLNPPGSGLNPNDDDFMNFSPNANTTGSRHVTAFYLETNVPLVGREFRLPLVQALELTASVRHENFTDFGDTTKPKVGLTWRPTQRVLFRASYNEGFRAPNLAQLFTGTLIRTVTGSTDTYRSIVTGLPTDGPSNRRRIASGNLALRPEESTGKSAGVVVEVPGVKGLSVALDYWEVRQENVIATSGSIADDTQALQAATQAALAAGQAIGAIDLGSGTPGYAGDPAVVRLPVTQADRDFFAAYNAGRAPGSQRAVVGAIDYLRTSYFNRSSQFVNGFDFDVNWRLPRTSAGNFTFNTSWSHLNDFHSYDAPGAPRTDLRWSNAAGVSGVAPKWRGTASVTWRKDQWGAGLSAYYTGDYTDSGATTNAATFTSLGQPGYIAPVFTNGSTVYRYVVEDSVSYNAYVSYRFGGRDRGWLSDLSLRLGVVNLLDDEPPLSSDSRGYDPAAYNLLARGRTWSLQLTKKL